MTRLIFFALPGLCLALQKDATSGLHFLAPSEEAAGSAKKWPTVRLGDDVIQQRGLVDEIAEAEERRYGRSDDSSYVQVQNARRTRDAAIAHEAATHPLVAEKRKAYLSTLEQQDAARQQRRAALSVDERWDAPNSKDESEAWLARARGDVKA